MGGDDMQYSNPDDYRLTRKHFDIINNNRRISGLPPLGDCCLKSSEKTTDKSFKNNTTMK